MKHFEAAFLKEQPSERTWWQRYGLAIGVVAIGWIAREELSSLVGPTELPFIFFFPAVAVATWYGGLWPGLLAAGTSATVANWFFFDSAKTGVQRAPYDVVATVSFLLACLFIIVAIETMHRTRAGLVRETLERRQAEAVRAQSQELLTTTLASIGDGVIVTDAQGRVNFMNAEAERLTQWTRSEAMGRPLTEVFRIQNEITRQSVENPAERVLQSGKTVGLANHTLLLAKDGREIPIDDSAAPIRTGDGPIFGVVLVFRDVTRQRKADLERARLAAIVESSGDAIVGKDLNGIVQSWNASAERMFGYRAEEIVGKSITMIIPKERMNEEVEILSDIRSGRPHHRVETVRVAKDGTQRHVSLSISPLKDADGRVVGASKILHDISDTLAAREALTREREMLLTTLRSIGDGVIVTDANSNVTFVNPEAERLTGWSQAEAEGVELAKVFNIVNEETRREVESPVQKVLRSGVVVGLANHTLLIAKDGRERPIDDSAAPIRYPDGRVFGVVLVFRDFTERRYAEQALRNSETALHDELRRKDEFLAILSHELRNPLAPIRMSSTLLNRVGPLDPEQEKLRAVIERQTNQLTRLLDDLLDISRITRGKISLRKERIDMRAAVSSAVESARPQIDSRRHELLVDTPGDPLYVEGDSARLSQIVTNLLSNASKYTDPGGRIAIAVRGEGSDAVVRVRDSGIGLTLEQRSHIFEMFAQARGDEPFVRGEGGLGVGLALSRMLVGLHGGMIEARSEGLGKGSEFVVRIPLAPATVVHAVESPQSDPLPQKQRRVLVADDNVDSAETLAALIRTDGHEVLTVHDGVAALEAWKNFRPDLIVLDIGMPKLSGYEVAQQIRSTADGSHPILVAVTGWGQEADKKRAKEAGFDHHLTKPVDPQAIEKLLE
jgi:PAS domain S-box-containing protein